MECKKHVVVIDAVPHDLPVNVSANSCKNKNVLLHKVFEDFTEKEYKSIFFLLMDYVKLDTFLDVTKQEKRFLERAFYELYIKFINSDKILIELLGTMKMYKKLRLLDTCIHVYKNQVNEFNQIDGIWKMLYSVCEELSDDDLNILKQGVLDDNMRDKIESSEDWFCWALQCSIFSKKDLSKLEIIFQKHLKCSNIIKNYRENNRYDSTLETYNIRCHSAGSYCGIALIINFETFDEQSKLTKRLGSDIDVYRLKNLWQHFGFKTEVFENKTHHETFELLHHYSTLDHLNYDVFVCCILSHGCSNSVYSSDGVPIPISNLIAAVTNNTNSSLCSKPKLFFIQACRGTNILENKGVGEQVYRYNTAPNPIIENSQDHPIKSDVLCAISSIDGFVSFRDVKDGSWYIDALCELMMEHGDKKSILDVMTLVTKKVHTKSCNFGPDGHRNAKQIADWSSTLEKTLILKKCINSNSCIH